jgi:N-acetylmuramoyl-L-alanine amidase
MRLVVVAVMLALACALPAAAAVLERVEVVGNVVRLHVSGAVSPEAHTLPPNGQVPERIYLDLPGVVLRAAPGISAGGADGALLRVRAGRFDEHTIRVVLDLARRVPFSVHREEGVVDIELTVADAAPPAPAPAVSAPAPPPAPPASAVPVASAPPPPPAVTPPAPAPRTASVPAAPPLEHQPEARSTAGPGHVHPVIVLDAGHGGHDPGAAGVGGVLEKDVVLDITRVFARRLMARLPVDVVLTRTDDSFVPIERRLALPGEGAALFISLHANACTDPSARGLEVFYGGGGAVRSASSRGDNSRAALLGRCLDHALAKQVGGVRGEARPAGFIVLARNPVPSALVEIGYLTHPDEAAQAQNTAYRERLADALVDGVAAFLRAAAPPL